MSSTNNFVKAGVTALKVAGISSYEDVEQYLKEALKVKLTPSADAEPAQTDQFIDRLIAYMLQGKRGEIQIHHLLEEPADMDVFKRAMQQLANPSNQDDTLLVIKESALKWGERLDKGRPHIRPPLLHDRAVGEQPGIESFPPLPSEEGFPPPDFALPTTKLLAGEEDFPPPDFKPPQTKQRPIIH